MDSIFDLAEFKPLQSRWHKRSAELARRESYYDGTVYDKLRNKMAWMGPRFYRAIKPLYLPLSRAVDVDAGIVPGGWTWPDPDKAEGIGQSQIDAWALARRRVFDWSNWQTRGVLYVHYGAQFGVVGLKVVDLRERGQVQVEPCNPRNFMLIENGQYDSTPQMAIWVEERTDSDGKPAEYAEVITPDLIRTFWNGKPLGIDGREPEYVNELGFVPFLQIDHMEVGKELGDCTYQRAMPMLDEVNRQASHLATIIEKHAEPQWAAIGAEQSDIVKSGDNIWFFPTGSDAKALVPEIDVLGVLEFIKTMADNLHGALPELAFDELKAKDQIATATVELQLMELTLKIRRVRPNYDQGLVEALRLAGRAAAGMSLGEIAKLDDPALAFDEDRPVLPVDPMDSLRLEMAEMERDTMRSVSQGEGLTNATNQKGVGDASVS